MNRRYRFTRFDFVDVVTLILLVAITIYYLSGD
jgi:hypothetical protein